MKKSALFAALLAVGASAVGCKTTPKLPWFGSGTKTAAETPESTAVARTAPALPSDLAKGGKAGAPSAAQVASAEAPPFVANANAQAAARPGAPNAYPSTAAPAFTPETARQVAGSATAGIGKEPSSGNLGSIAMRYDPTKAPKTAENAVAQATPSTPNRYGAAVAAPTAAAAQRTTDVIASAPSFGGYPAGSRYGVPAAQGGAAAQASAAPAATAQASVTPAAAAPAPANTGVVNPNNRYAQAGSTTPSAASASRYDNTATPASAIVESTPRAGSPSVTPAANAVAVAPKVYRPGNTSSYPGVPSLASRPQTGAAASTESAPATTPATPGSTATPASTSAPASVPRYW